jgi:hypothetical protein
MILEEWPPGGAMYKEVELLSSPCGALVAVVANGQVVRWFASKEDLVGFINVWGAYGITIPYSEREKLLVQMGQTNLPGWEAQVSMVDGLRRDAFNKSVEEIRALAKRARALELNLEPNNHYFGLQAEN